MRAATLALAFELVSAAPSMAAPPGLLGVVNGADLAILLGNWTD